MNPLALVDAAATNAAVRGATRPPVSKVTRCVPALENRGSGAGTSLEHVARMLLPSSRAARATTALFFSLVATTAVTNARASSFDDATGEVHLDAGLAIAANLDSASSLGGLPAKVFSVQRQTGYALYTSADEALSFVDASAALEGKGALRVHGDRAVLLGDAASLASIAGARVEVTMFARADGAAPSLRVVYARKPLDAPSLSFPTGAVAAIRTGRATSDGWVEYSTGPIDGTVLGATIAGLLVVAGDPGSGDASFVVDAIEVKKVDGPLLSAGDCHVASEAKDCAKGAVCMEGKCVDSAVAYGALPPLETRKDAAARAATYMTRFQNDRHAVAAAASAGLDAKLLAIANAADTPASFVRPYLAAIGGLRGAHTSAPAPSPTSRLALGATAAVRFTGSELNACFGVVEKDLAGGGRGFGVFSVASPSLLHVGDVVDTVDGEPVDAWVARNAPEQRLLAADPDSDRAYEALLLTPLVMRFGRELVVKRCAAAGDCTPVTVDLSALRKDAATSIQAMQCSPRFKLGVTVPAGTNPDAYEAAIATTDGAITTLHTNGEPYVDNAPWVATVKQAFATAANGLLLVDKRRGDGGGGDAIVTWGSELRRGEGYGLFWVYRLDQASIDGPPGFLADLLGTCDGRSRAGNCAYGQLEAYPASPGAAPAKTAWLVTLDGSASDMSTSFAKGAPGVRIFGPNRTMGLFGGLGVMGAFLEGWSGGSVQLGDVRAGETPAERVAGAFRSGRGVDPDEIVVETQSDLVTGRDTLLERARAWLAQ